jgi:hypothetical protein
MASQIRRDLYWANKGPEWMDCPVEMEPDFLHEATQRLIFYSLATHKDEELMLQPAHIIHHCEDTLFPDVERVRSGSQRKRHIVVRSNKHVNKTISARTYSRQ